MTKKTKTTKLDNVLNKYGFQLKTKRSKPSTTRHPQSRKPWWIVGGTSSSTDDPITVRVRADSAYEAEELATMGSSLIDEVTFVDEESPKKTITARSKTSQGTVTATYPIELAGSSFRFAPDKILEEHLGQCDSSGAGMGERDLTWSGCSKTSFEAVKKHLARAGLLRVVKLTFTRS